jgi:hypothetical protein
MKTIICPAPRVNDNSGFKPFNMQTLEDVQVKADRGISDDGKPLKDYFTGKCDEGKVRIVMADEAAGVNAVLIAKYQPLVVAKMKGQKTESAIRKALVQEIGHLALLHTPEGLVAIEGEEAVWSNNQVARTAAGLKVE